MASISRKAAVVSRRSSGAGGQGHRHDAGEAGQAGAGGLLLCGFLSGPNVQVVAGAIASGFPALKAAAVAAPDAPAGGAFLTASTTPLWRPPHAPCDDRKTKHANVDGGALAVPDFKNELRSERSLWLFAGDDPGDRDLHLGRRRHAAADFRHPEAAVNNGTRLASRFRGTRNFTQRSHWSICSNVRAGMLYR
jgi:hypothetical protein